MARPERNTVDYFPFLCKEGKAMYYIEAKYGNDGYAGWIKILRQLAVTNNHFLNLSDKIELMFLASKCKITEEKLVDIISDLCDLGEFHAKLWSEFRIVFNEKFVEHIEDAYKKRNNNCITLSGLRVLLVNLRILKPDYCLQGEYNNTQSKVKKSKEEESKEDKSEVNEKKTPPRNFEDLIFKKGDEWSNELSPDEQKTIFRQLKSKFPETRKQIAEQILEGYIGRFDSKFPQGNTKENFILHWSYFVTDMKFLPKAIQKKNATSYSIKKQTINAH